jgi:hypothetical protein
MEVPLERRIAGRRRRGTALEGEAAGDGEGGADGGDCLDELSASLRVVMV